MCGLGKVWAAGLKSLVYCQQSAKYCCQLSKDFVATMHSDIFQGDKERGFSIAKPFWGSSVV